MHLGVAKSGGGNRTAAATTMTNTWHCVVKFNLHYVHFENHCANTVDMIVNISSLSQCASWFVTGWDTKTLISPSAIILYFILLYYCLFYFVLF